MWGRKTKLFVTFGTLIILCGLLVQSKRGLPKKPTKAITNSHRAARTQKLKNRRNYIIKCCGKKSCLPTNPKLRPKHLENRTTVSTTVLEVKETSQAPNPKQTTVDLPGSSIQATEQTTNPNDANKLMETTAHLDPTADPSSTSGDVVTEKSTSSLSSLESETTLAADRPTEQQSAKTTDNYQQIATTQDVAKLTTSFKTSNPTSSITIPATSSQQITATLIRSSITTKPSSIGASTATTTAKITIKATTVGAASTKISTSSSSQTSITTTRAKPTTTLFVLTNRPTTFRTSSTTTTTTFRPLTNERLYTCSSTQCTRNNTLARSDPAFVYRSTWYSACGNSFIFGTQLVSWEENFKMCCSVGMIPISIESETKLSCLASLMNSNWPFSIYYWTSGRKLFHPNSTFEFCLSSGNIVTNTTTQIWAPGEPVGMWDRLCVLLALDKKTNSALLYVRNCSEKSIFACQGPMTTTPAPNPRYSNCKKVSKCTKNETLFSELSNKGVQLTNYEKYGMWLFKSGRAYLISPSTATWADASATCCSIGMKLLSIDYTFKYDSLTTILTENKSIANTYWTSGARIGDRNFFGWCATDKRVRDAKWAPGLPGSADDCVAVNLIDNKVQIADKNCQNTYNYICEARDTRTSTTAGRAILNECGLLYNITEEQIDSLWSSKSFDLRLKCFIKCVGEFGNYIVDGQIVTQEMIKLAQELSLSSDMDTYNKNVAAASICGNQVGMDECDTASLVFSCVQDESPDIVQRAILNVETSNEVEFAALPSAQALCRDSSSVAFLFRAECRKAYVDEDPKPCGKRAFYNVCGGRNYVITDSNTTNGIGPATGACMDWGLKLASFETYEEFMCVAELFALTNATVYAWTSGSFWILSDKPVWCGSNTPLKTSKYPWNLDGRKTLVGIPLGREFLVQLVIPANSSKDSFLKTVQNGLQPGGSICEN